MPVFSDSDENMRGPERRSTKRSAVALTGNLFYPEQSREIACIVKDISPSGAGLICDCGLQPGSKIVLYVTALGRFEGQIVMHKAGHVSIHFEHSERMQKKIAEKIFLFLEGGSDDEARLRTAPRVREVSMRTFTRRDGGVVDCDVADISLTGASLKTDVRPPIGEIIHIGRSTGRIVRHHDEGIAIEFLDADEVQPVLKKRA